VNVQFLIDAIVRQTTVLIAQLATSGGLRAPLAHVANEVFLKLANELDEQGVSRRISADMFGMALRAYLRKIQRLRESRTDQGRSLWEGVLVFVREKGVVGRHEVLERFARDDEELVRGVLHDLTESGLVFRSGTEERDRMGHLPTADVDELLWLTVYREGPLDRDALTVSSRAAPERMEAALERLVSSKRVRVVHRDGVDTYVADEFVIPLGQSLGWEAAVLDHYRAVLHTVCRRLDADAPPTAPDVVGGSTYTFDVWPGHPMAEEVQGWLRRFRHECADLRKRLESHNASTGVPAEYTQVVVYGGQHVTAASRLETDEP
jgi:hypothetical protein